MGENKRELSGDYLAGYVDGEGCFVLRCRRDVKHNRLDRKIREYFYWGVEFVVVTRADDEELLVSVQNTLGCGKISHQKARNLSRFSVQNLKDLYQKIVPFFEKYRLVGKKRLDFDLWCEAVRLIYSHRGISLNVEKGTQGFTNKPLDQSTQVKLFRIRNKMLVYKSKRSKDFRWGTNLTSFKDPSV